MLLTSAEVARATGDKVVSATPLSYSCVYGLGYPQSVTSMNAPYPDVFEENKSGYEPKPIAGLGADAYCITIAAIEKIPGGGRINVKLTDGRVYQIWGTYSCEQLLPLARAAVARN
ncbi:hypothetical protein ACFWFQ_00725 [Nocardia salmonicida]|uniref:hypothetical protein n=1 Tax=Nocardia salmonicida TaxID=53431 RepID=UPI0036502858